MNEKDKKVEDKTKELLSREKAEAIRFRLYDTDEIKRPILPLHSSMHCKAKVVMKFLEER